MPLIRELGEGVGFQFLEIYTAYIISNPLISDVESQSNC